MENQAIIKPMIIKPTEDETRVIVEGTFENFKYWILTKDSRDTFYLDCVPKKQKDVRIEQEKGRLGKIMSANLEPSRGIVPFLCRLFGRQNPAIKRYNKANQEYGEMLVQQIARDLNAPLDSQAFLFIGPMNQPLEKAVITSYDCGCRCEDSGRTIGFEIAGKKGKLTYVRKPCPRVWYDDGFSSELTDVESRNIS